MTDRRATILAGITAVIVMALAVFVFSGNDDGAGRTITTGDIVAEAPTTSAEPAEAAAPDTEDPTAVDDETAADDGNSGEEAADPPPPTGPFSDLDTVDIADLPPDAWITLNRIDRGGPYPYRQDDETFQNREGILPDRPLGHYREYTVDTPGSADRGARRIVTGADGERYWTDDHYDSFREIVGDLAEVGG